MATQDQVDNLIEILDYCTEDPVPSLVENPRWGTINFESARIDLERAFTMCSHLKALPLLQLPDDVIGHIVQQATPIKKSIEALRQFTIERDNPSAARDNLVSQIKSHADQFYKAVHIYIPYLAYQKGEIQQNIRELTASVAKAKSLVEEGAQLVSQKKGEIEEIVQVAREASASVGVAHFTADFEREHSELEESSRRWLNATLIAALVTIGFGVFFLNTKPELHSVSHAVHYVTSKLIILGVLITATVWCGNIYKALRHLSVVNKFKANSLKTFQAFIKASAEDATRDAVLLETTRAIFHEGATGYLDGNQKTDDRSARVIELIRNVSQAASARSKTDG